MNITILDGWMGKGIDTYPEYIRKLSAKLSEEHHTEIYQIDAMDLKYCTGCWSCWWKTPGRCAMNDGAEKIFRSVIHSDFVIFTSPLSAGYVTSALKKIMDRLIVLLHPYIILKNGEAHHRKRYEKYPDFGVLVSKEHDTDAEDLRIVSDLYDRFALNFHSKKKYFKVIDDAAMEDVIHETCND